MTPNFVQKNISRIYSESRALGCSYLDIEAATGVPAFDIGAFIFGAAHPQTSCAKPVRPDKDTYNKLAAFFEWEVWE